MVKTTVRTHDKKLKELTRNVVLPFSPAETVLNLSGTRLSDDELKILKYRSKHSIEPFHITKTDVLTMFDFIHWSMSKGLKHEKNAGEVKAKMFYLANSYVNTYKPLRNTLRKHKIIKKLKDMLITKPVKRNGVIIVNRAIYMSSLYVKFYMSSLYETIIMIHQKF